MPQVGHAPSPHGHRSAAATWLGHATVLLEIDGVRVLTDPVLRGRIGPLVRTAGPARDVEPVDCVVLSHLHADHTDLATLRRLARSGPVLVPHPAARWLVRAGLGEVLEMRVGEQVTVGGVRVSATPAVHEARRRPGPLGPAAEPVGYHLRGSRSVYFAGDTDLFPAMADLRGAVDLALLPVWGWGPDVGEGHLDPERAASAAALIEPLVAIPIHWGTFALPWAARRQADPVQPARRFAELTRERSPAVDVRVLAVGERTEF
jgi:L-ascorbate metabolism protein UlaG (beta-lactamase superfamily)